MTIREVTPASPTNTNFFPKGFCMVDYENPQPPLPSQGRTEESGRACAYNDDIPGISLYQELFAVLVGSVYGASGFRSA